MTDLHIDPSTGDLSLTNNSLRLTTTKQELTRQRVEITLRTFKGEWFANINFGIPYLKNKNNPEQGLGKRNKRFLDTNIKEAIINTTGITRLISFDSTLDRQQRELSVSFKAETEQGDIVSGDGIVVVTV